MNCPSCSEDGCVVEMQPDPTAEGRLTCPLRQYTELPRRGIDIPAAHDNADGDFVIRRVR